MRLSVAIPVFNEAAVLPELIERTLSVLDRIPGGPHELLFIDDGSSDGSSQLLDAAAEEDRRVAVVHLSRNFGHQAAISAGIDHAAGDALVIMDGDLQDPPEAIPALLEKSREGFDIVYAIRVGRKESLLLRLCYFTFYRLIARLSAVRLPLDAGDFSLMSRRVVDGLRAAPERNRYLRGLRSWVGFKQTGIEIERSARRAGEPKYDSLSLLRLALDGIFSFSLVPLRAAVLLGVGGVLTACGYSAYAVYAKFFLSQSPTGFTALVVLLVFLASLQFLVLGIFGEYLGRVYEEVKRRPLYVVAATKRT